MNDNQPERILICGLSWIGDSIMSMPAVQDLRKKHPQAHLVLLIKKAMVPLWEMHKDIDEIYEFKTGLEGTSQTVALLKKTHFDIAYILPNSFRSALIPFLVGVPERIGFSGHSRNWMLSYVRPIDAALENQHQAYEYYQLFDLPAPDTIPAPRLKLPEDLQAWVSQEIEQYSGPIIGLLPGAARGPSKQWPAENYIGVGRLFVSELSANVLVLGAPNEIELCSSVASGIGNKAYSYAGKTNLQQWAALMSRCDYVIANDSGGMHLATALERPTIAIYGITDPSKTGPLGSHCEVLQKSRVRHRDIPRVSPQAAEALEVITPEEVFEATGLCR